MPLAAHFGSWQLRKSMQVSSTNYKPFLLLLMLWHVCLLFVKHILCPYKSYYFLSSTNCHASRWTKLCLPSLDQLSNLAIHLIDDIFNRLSFQDLWELVHFLRIGNILAQKLHRLNLIKRSGKHQRTWHPLPLDLFWFWIDSSGFI